MNIPVWYKLMTGKIEIPEYGVEDVNDSLKELWLALAREMLKIDHFILPSEANGERWVKFVR